MRPTIEDQNGNVYEIDERGTLQLPPLWRRNDTRASKTQSDDARCSYCHTPLEADKRSHVPDLRVEIEEQAHEIRRLQEECDNFRAELTDQKARYERLQLAHGEALKPEALKLKSLRN